MRYRKRPCFGRRWWHRRLRKIDEEILFSQLRLLAPDPETAIAAIELHKEFDDGHWHCPCAQEDERER